jgi:hypothetical protein
MMNASSRRRKRIGNESDTAAIETVTQSPSDDRDKRQGIFFLRGRRNGIFVLLVIVTWLAVSAKKSPLVKSSSNTTEASDPSEVVLRRDWTSFTRLSPLAQRFKDQQQSNCQVGESRNRFSALGFGLGSELHGWTQQLCEAYSRNKRLRTELFKDKWTWLDETSCNHTQARDISALSCYFPSAEGSCTATPDNKVPDTPSWGSCENLKQVLNLTTPNVRAAGIEFLFSHVSPLIIAEAQRQAQLVFGGKPIPKNLITVHVRWGDKVTSREMKFVPIQDYIGAVATLAKQRNNGNPREKVSVYLATEDPKAVQQFHEKAPSDWDIYVDQYYHEVKKHRQVGKELWNQAVATSRETKGRAGLLTLASLLVAMEAKDYVLTTASNWSRLMDELRSAILDVECNNCTRMIDLQAPAPNLPI